MLVSGRYLKPTIAGTMEKNIISYKHNSLLFQLEFITTLAPVYPQHILALCNKCSLVREGHRVDSFPRMSMKREAWEFGELDLSAMEVVSHMEASHACPIFQ